MATELSLELRHFHSFVEEKLHSEDSFQASPEEVLAEWRELHPQDSDLADSIRSLRLAIADMEAGHIGRPADEVIAEVRQRILSGATP